MFSLILLSMFVFPAVLQVRNAFRKPVTRRAVALAQREIKTRR